MPIYNFVHNLLSSHFLKLKNHLKNIFLSIQNIMLHVQIFLFLILLEYYL